MKLVVLESPTKTKALQKFLGDQYQVVSCNGHIKKMQKTGVYKLGIDHNTFKPLYEIDPIKKPLLKNILRLAKSADAVYLATDPDREGEAIAQHLADELPKKVKHYRVLFNEITESAVLTAFKQPTTINENLVASQATRRVLDRMIGFRLSKLLQEKIFSKSAGRVQSVALHLLSKREKVIQSFVSEAFWDLQFELVDYHFVLKTFNHKKIRLNTKLQLQAAQKVLKNPAWQLIADEKKLKITQPPQFLTTSKLLQLAVSKLGFSIKQTTYFLQKLYEGIAVEKNVVGFITYPRTDSVRVNKEFLIRSHKFLRQKYGTQFVDTKPQTPKLILADATKNIQNAHEAIRITDWNMTPEKANLYLDCNLLKLYILIYHNTAKPLLKPQQTIVQKVVINNQNYQFHAQKEFIKFIGFDIVTNNLQNTAKQPIDFKLIALKNLKLIDEAKQTKPPNAFGEGELIRVMEQNGVGRPSTYNKIVSKLIENIYVKQQERKLRVTEKGLVTDDFLQKHFQDIINAEYTAGLELRLDQIVENPEIRQPFLAGFWTKFNAKVQEKSKHLEKLPPKILEKKCPLCQAQLNQRQGRFGVFIGCSNFPDCKYIQKSTSNQKPPELVNETCPKCGHQLQKRRGKYGPFLGCSNFPDCKYIKKNQPSQAPKILDEKCPQCDQKLVQRIGRYGNFVGCSNYPKCKYRPKSKRQPPIKTKIK